MEKFIELCGNQKILIITSASADPVDAGEYSVKLFKKHGEAETLRVVFLRVLRLSCLSFTHPVYVVVRSFRVLSSLIFL